ncbi:hypothetical protein EDD22DRAFT_847968 [Suillus occidentalis]|nr:hypothetical protein EDD22DRAFT_847968 [Suillus occidentalis]
MSCHTTNPTNLSSKFVWEGCPDDIMFTHHLAPWVHYVPIQIDYSDLYDALLFFRGDPSGHGAHKDLAKAIARQAREWSLGYWRREDMVAYLYRLFLEYARVMHEDRDLLNFELEKYLTRVLDEGQWFYYRDSEELQETIYQPSWITS